MSSVKQPLEAYLEKIYQSQYGLNKKDNPLSSRELKEIALAMGLNEEDWQETQKKAEQCFHRAEVFANAYNWGDSLTELELAVTLNPNHLGVLCLLAEALYQKGESGEDETLIKRAELYLDRCFYFDPVHKQGLALKNSWDQREKRDLLQGKRSNRKFILAAIGLLLLILLCHWQFSSQLLDAELKVQQQWAQLENVIHRKALLIPEWPMQGQQASIGIEKEVLQEIASFEKLTPGLSPKETYAYNTEMSSILRKLVLSRFENKKSIGKAQDFQVLFEGAENRISVEIKRYNEAVNVYNGKCLKWPYSMYSKVAKPYFSGELSKP